MVSPVTIGSLVAGVLAMVAEAGIKEAIKDAYTALKDAISEWASSEVSELERTPSSMGRQILLAEVIDARSDDDKKHLPALAEAIVLELKESAPAIGLDIQKLISLELQIGNINVGKGLGARIKDSEIDVVKVGDISVNDRMGK